MHTPTTTHAPSPPTRRPRTPPTSPTPMSPRLASAKVDELSQLESRLLSASARALDSGYFSRASSYSRQVSAVRRERERWTLLQNNPTPPTPIPHLFAAALAVLLPILDWIVAGGVAARRLARIVLSIGLLVAAVVLGTSPNSVWTNDSASDTASGSPNSDVPDPWAKEIAQAELARPVDFRLVPRLTSVASAAFVASRLPRFRRV